MIVTIYFTVFKSKDDKDEGLDLSTGGSKTVTGADSTLKAATFPLKQGSSGKEVLQLQKFLNQEANKFLIEDGIWGSGTQKAVEDYCFRPNLVTTVCEDVINKDIFDSYNIGKY